MTQLKILFTAFILFASIIFSQDTPLKQWSNVYNNGSNSNTTYDMIVDLNGNGYYCCTKTGSNGFPVPYLLKYNSSGTLQFSKQFVPNVYPRGINPVAGICRDNQNNIFMAGVFDSGSVYIAFVTKFNSNGDTLWTRNMGGTVDSSKNVAWTSIIADNAGNVYVSGPRFVTTPSFKASLYTAKYSSTGDLIWISEHSYTQGTFSIVQKTPIIIDSNGNLIVSFAYKKNNNAGDLDYDIIALKYSPSGTELWYSMYNTPGNQQDIPTDIDLDNNGNVYISGICYVIVSPNTISEFACIKLNGADGTLSWVYKTRGDYISAIHDNAARSISISKNSNEVYVAGTIYNTATSKDGLLVKLNPVTGTETWRRTTPHVYEEMLLCSAVDSMGNIYVAGQNYAYNNNYLLYCAKYNSTGDVLWRKSDNVTRSLGSLTIALDHYNSIYFSTTLGGTPTDIYAAKYLQVAPQSQTFCRSVNKPILDNQHTYDTVNVTGLPPQAIITGIELKIDTILHTNSPDMQATLRSPQGLVDTLFKNPGISTGGPNMINCVITDTASTQLGNSAAPPFTGYYKPYSPLSAYEGYEPNGNWIFSIYDNLNAETGTLKKYCLVVHYYDLATIGIQQISNVTPMEYLLGQNYPNPFNPTTNIKFSIPKSGNVTMKVYDILGKQVAELVNEYKFAGSYVVDFNAASLSSGVYFYRLETEGVIQTKKMLLVK